MVNDLIKCLITNGFVRFPWGFQKGSIHLVDNTHIREGYLTPLISLNIYGYREERQFDNVNTLEQLNSRISKALLMHKGKWNDISLLTT